MISVLEINKAFNQKEVLHNISFEVQRGEVLGFLGPNGAGKTTTMRIITGFLSPDSGSIKIDKDDVSQKSLEVRKKIGYLPENNPLYDSMRVYEYLKFIASIKHIKNIQDELKRVVKICALKKEISKTISELSKGYRQRVGLASALLGDPEILILDEPTNGLDPNQAAEIREVIKEIGKTKTIIFSTHILQEVQSSCTRALIINEGKIVGQGTVDELIHQAKGETSVLVTIDGANDANIVNEEIRKISGVKSVKLSKHQEYIISIESGVDIRRSIFELCVQKSWVLLGMQSKEMSLEDVFKELTTV